MESRAQVVPCLCQALVSICCFESRRVSTKAEISGSLPLPTPHIHTAVAAFVGLEYLEIPVVMDVKSLQYRGSSGCEVGWDPCHTLNPAR